ncbi:uncharacterized protein LOC142020848 [Carettochelys insculpta]|uniref:uncharacterized protein LOC142020848 n=1 Tax=Carettochelys insculpta TaxID=44489 RepID=UPI003EBD6E59
MKGPSVVSCFLLVLVTTWNLDKGVEGQPQAHVRCTKLCTKFSEKKIPLKLLKSYRKTEPSCPKTAIIFTPQKSKAFCADPEASWVKQAIQHLDRASVPRNPPPSSALPPATTPDKGGVFQRLIDGAVSPQPQAPESVNPIHGAGTTVSQAVRVTGRKTDAPSLVTLTVQETTGSSVKASSAFQETFPPHPTHPEPFATSSEVSIGFITTPQVAVPGSPSSSFNSISTPLIKRPESVLESTSKSTGLTLRPTTETPGPGPRRFKSTLTPVIKRPDGVLESTSKSTGSALSPTTETPGPGPSGLNSNPTRIGQTPESPVQPTYKATGSTRNQTASVLASAPGTLTTDAPSTVNGTEITKFAPMVLTTAATLESLPSKLAAGLVSMGHVNENSTMKPTAVRKGPKATKRSTLHLTSPGGDMSSVSRQRGDGRAALSESSTARDGDGRDARGTSRSFPESMTPPVAPVLSFTSFLQSRTQPSSVSPEVLAESTPSVLSASRAHLLSLALLGSIFCVSSVALWMYVRSKECSRESAKEAVHTWLFKEQGF